MVSRCSAFHHSCSDICYMYEYNSNESTDKSKVLFHALGAWRVSPAFHDILWTPTVTRAAAQLLHGAPRFWHDQLFCKPAHHGGVVAWHQVTTRALRRSQTRVCVL